MCAAGEVRYVPVPVLDLCALLCRHGKSLGYCYLSAPTRELCVVMTPRFPLPDGVTEWNLERLFEVGPSFKRFEEYAKDR